MTDKTEKNPSYVINTFPSFNAHVDEAMQYLTGDEYKILTFAQRHIYGWKDDDPSKGKSISLSMFEKGFTTKTGKHYGGTGLGRKTIINNLVRLVKYGLLVELGKPTPKGQIYTIGQNPDIHGLANDEQSLERQAANKQRAAKMTAARVAKYEGGSSHDTGSSDDTGSSHEPASGSSHDTGTGSSHDTQLNTYKHTETQQSAALSPSNGKVPKGMTADTHAMAHAFKQLTGSIVGVENETDHWRKENHRAAQTLLDAGVTVALLCEFYPTEYTSYTPSGLAEVSRKIGAWLKKRKPAAPPKQADGYRDFLKEQGL
jgi:hypothetical protein